MWPLERTQGEKLTTDDKHFVVKNMLSIWKFKSLLSGKAMCSEHSRYEELISFESIIYQES